MTTPAFDLREVARHYRALTGDGFRVFRYWNDDETEWVDVYSAADHPQPGVTTWGTLGTSRYPSGYETADGRSIRVELVAEMASDVDTVGNMLVGCALDLAHGVRPLGVDTIVPDVVRQYEPSVSTVHLLLTDVFSFEGLGVVERDDAVLTFLQAVPVTDAEARFAERQGVGALTDLLAARSVDVLDLDRPAVVTGEAPGGVAYAERVDPVERVPVGPLDVDEARRRYTEGPTFSVLVPGTDRAEPVVLEVDAGASRVVARFHGPGGALTHAYLFRRRDDRVFLDQIDVFGYAGDDLVAELDVDLEVVTPYAPGHVVRHERLWFRPDGTAGRTVDDAAAEALTVEDRGGLAVDGLWADVPEFGDWTDLARFDR